MGSNFPHAQHFVAKFFNARFLLPKYEYEYESLEGYPLVIESLQNLLTFSGKLYIFIIHYILQFISLIIILYFLLFHRPYDL